MVQIEALTALVVSMAMEGTRTAINNGLPVTINMGLLRHLLPCTAIPGEVLMVALLSTIDPRIVVQEITEETMEDKPLQEEVVVTMAVTNFEQKYINVCVLFFD